MRIEFLNAARKPFALMQTPITALFLQAQGVSTKIVAPLADIAGTQQIILHPASGIREPQDLLGKRIGMARDTAIYLALHNMSRDYGLDLAQVTFIDLLPHEQLEAFRSGAIDVMACWEPWTTRARKLGGEFFFSGARSEIPALEGDVNWLVDQACLIVPDEHLYSDPQDVLAILHVLRKATNLINQQRQHVAQELAVFFGMSPQDLILEMRKNLYSMKFDNLFRIGMLTFRDFLYREGLVAQNFAEAQLYDTAWLKQIDPALVDIEDTVLQGVPIVARTNVYYRQDVAISGDGRDIRFLLVDDSKVVRRALAQTVGILGGTLLGEAMTGQQAIDLFDELRPNFVTMDLSMPGLSGIDAIKQILRRAPQTNVIVISATDLQELRDEVFDLGVKIFIVKPFDPLLVAEIIGLLLL